MISRSFRPQCGHVAIERGQLKRCFRSKTGAKRQSRGQQAENQRFIRRCFIVFPKPGPVLSVISFGGLWQILKAASKLDWVALLPCKPIALSCGFARRSVSSSMQSIVTISNLSKTYANGYNALIDVNLDIASGEILALLGPNGAGKTTLISIICGIVNASNGYGVGQWSRYSQRVPSNAQPHWPGSPGVNPGCI